MNKAGSFIISFCFFQILTGFIFIRSSFADSNCAPNDFDCEIAYQKQLAAQAQQEGQEAQAESSDTSPQTASYQESAPSVPATPSPVQQMQMQMASQMGQMIGQGIAQMLTGPSPQEQAAQQQQQQALAAQQAQAAQQQALAAQQQAEALARQQQTIHDHLVSEMKSDDGTSYGIQGLPGIYLNGSGSGQSSQQGLQLMKDDDSGGSAGNPPPNEAAPQTEQTDQQNFGTQQTSGGLQLMKDDDSNGNPSNPAAVQDSVAQQANGGLQLMNDDDTSSQAHVAAPAPMQQQADVSQPVGTTSQPASQSDNQSQQKVVNLSGVPASQANLGTGQGQSGNVDFDGRGTGNTPGPAIVAPGGDDAPTVVPDSVVAIPQRTVNFVPQYNFGRQSAVQVQPVASNFAGSSQVPMNSQIADIMRSIDSIQVPPPLPENEVSLSWESVTLSKEHADALLQVGDIGLLAWEMAGRIGSSINFPCKVLMIAGKIFIAGEDGAYVYLVKQDKVFDEALEYLKNPATSKQFAQLVSDIKEGRPYNCSDPEMLKAAQALNDPNLKNSGTWLAWDSMLSPEAKAAMVKKGCMEVGTELVSEGTEGLAKDLTEREGLFDTMRVERKQAQNLLKYTTDPAEQAQLMSAIQKTDSAMQNLYKIQKAGPKALGTMEGIFVSGEAEKSDSE